MINSIFSDEISFLNSQRLELIPSDVRTRCDSEDVLDADFGNSNAATFSGQDRDAIFGMLEHVKMHLSF